jgi:CheY-like chemotaxis protein
MNKDARPSVLVADNNPVDRALLCSYLENLGIFPDAAAHGREALDAFRRHAYSLVFMECRMPVMDGFAAVREIRAAESGKGTRACIVGIVEKDGEDWAGNGLPQGMDALVHKPVAPEDVKKFVAAALRDGERLGGRSE